MENINVSSIFRQSLDKANELEKEINRLEGIEENLISKKEKLETQIKSIDKTKSMASCEGFSFDILCSLSKEKKQEVNEVCQLLNIKKIYSE